MRVRTAFRQYMTPKRRHPWDPELNTATNLMAGAIDGIMGLGHPVEGGAGRWDGPFDICLADGSTWTVTVVEGERWDA